jgi:predicted glycogen debranching enzyme
VIRLEQTICADLDRASTLEWLETNGLGGFASSTITGMNTRRYHGLLIAATNPPVGRVVLLSKIEETVEAGGRRYDLAVNQYPGVIHPQGHRYLTGFRLDPFPVFVYAVEDVEIEKRVFMVHGENTTVVEYRQRAGPACRLELRPLIAFRDFHATTHRNGALDRRVRTGGGIAAVAPYPGLPELFFGHDAGSLNESGDWYFNFEYRREQERGLDFREDLFNPFVLRFDLRRGAAATVVASTSPRAAADAPALLTRERERRNQVLRGAPSNHPLIRRLAAAADQFIVRRGDGNSIIAGYHWFEDWGRDSMISLSGLTLATNRPDAARNILETFVGHADHGVLPNRFPDSGEPPEYHTADATLWLFEAVRSYLNSTADREFVRVRLYDRLKEIVDWHLRGTPHGIRVASDGLLECAARMTWMDARIGDAAVTPRAGRPVEIQALWYNALRILQGLARDFGDHSARARLETAAETARHAFNAQFWNADAGCLFDLVDGARRDAAIRPNQILAVSLHHGMLAPFKRRQVVEVVQRELLTPLGLRTLARGDPHYRGLYQGDPTARDSAYHQGTVWPWLLGPFVSAYLKVHNNRAQARRQAQAWLQALEEHLAECGLGQIAEIADGDPPHHPRGSIAQAWSVAELLRVAQAFRL